MLSVREQVDDVLVLVDYLGKHVRIKIIYCPGCNEGTLMLKYMEFVLYKFETMSAKNQDFEIDSATITELI
jgi:hypothetical protein